MVLIVKNVIIIIKISLSILLKFWRCDLKVLVFTTVVPNTHAVKGVQLMGAVVVVENFTTKEH